jgi:hypothetical protein
LLLTLYTYFPVPLLLLYYLLLLNIVDLLFQIHFLHIIPVFSEQLDLLDQVVGVLDPLFYLLDVLERRRVVGRARGKRWRGKHTKIYLMLFRLGLIWGGRFRNLELRFIVYFYIYLLQLE